MFHSVKILDARGKIKKVVSAESLSKRHWKEFLEEKLSRRNQNLKGKGQKPKKQVRPKKQSDVSYDDSYFSED